MATRGQVEEWIGRCALGDRKAFVQLYDATSAKLFGVALRVLNDRAEAEEVLQEIYVRIWQNAGRYASNGLSPMSWLITIARNRAIDRLRARKSGGGRGEMEEVADLADAAPGPEAQTIAAGEAARLAACLETLPEGRAEAVRRAYMEGETYAELAERFAVPLNTIRTWLRRGLISLRECLSV
ncbi:sigma-70 family RNA polymerase sigma factor [Pseudoroseicyclus tamaricis]|uniref:Sigma-70 family RNA polymerase sigma factor n=1 Tax=Pseudoroseicyclus tamaricis TaxID=2705421 RepID=A0A6B2JQA2_9RHOB|nr:sigma-70 family RNA polymerase sigma factor [Pseudoroseicyclus tamaricis]NDV00145.1 sigma-70 family RNA polymerase sigma factor [Pseudoroseicyclus tamaricis]